MVFIKKHQLLILVSIILLLTAIFRDAYIFEIIYNREVIKINETVLTKIIYWCMLIGALFVRWLLILNEVANPYAIFKKKG